MQPNKPNEQPTVAIIGASADRRKFGNKAVRAFAAKGFRVFPINLSAGEIEGHRAYQSILDVPVERLNRASLYVPPQVGVQLLEEIARKGVDELWVNPGAESDELFAKAEKLGIPIVFACSIVGVGVNPESMDV
jgi:predicted CoA-binding protein